jgi:phosphoribosylamine-glycine ligase
VTARGPAMALARARAYDAVPGWAFDGARWRRDIGAAFA